MTSRPRRTQGMNWIRQEKRLAIYLRDGLACIYCGSSVEVGAQLTLDHVVTYSAGGSNDARNLVTACHRCNSARGNRSIALWLKAVAQYVNHGVTVEQLRRDIRNATARKLDLTAAKEMIALRGSAARAMAN